MKFIIRFITLAAYFLPFCFFHTTCVGSDYKIAYNLQDAIINEAQADSIENISVDPIITDTVKNTGLVRDTTKWKKFSTLFDGSSKNDSLSSAGAEWQTYLVSPTKESLSALGCIFEYKNLYGSIFIGVSLFLSLISLFLWRFFLKKKITLPALILNFISINVVLIDSFISKIDLLWGFWLLFGLVLIQLIIQIKNKQVNLATDSAEVINN